MRRRRAAGSGRRPACRAARPDRPRCRRNSGTRARRARSRRCRCGSGACRHRRGFSGSVMSMKAVPLLSPRRTHSWPVSGIGPAPEAVRLHGLAVVGAEQGVAHELHAGRCCCTDRPRRKYRPRTAGGVREPEAPARPLRVRARRNLLEVGRIRGGRLVRGAGERSRGEQGQPKARGERDERIPVRHLGRSPAVRCGLRSGEANRSGARAGMPGSTGTRRHPPWRPPGAVMLVACGRALVLGIETSCDDTACAVVDGDGPGARLGGFEPARGAPALRRRRARARLARAARQLAGGLRGDAGARRGDARRGRRDRRDVGAGAHRLAPRRAVARARDGLVARPAVLRRPPPRGAPLLALAHHRRQPRGALSASASSGSSSRAGTPASTGVDAGGAPAR